jgi:hypothetical protein
MRYDASLGRGRSAATVVGLSRRDRSFAAAEPNDRLAPLSEVLREIGTTLLALLGAATAAYVMLRVFGSF